MNEEPEEPVVAASVADDYEEELEVAREQGRREALTEVTRHNSDDVITAVARDHDDESQAESIVDETKKRKVLCWAFLLCCLLVTVGAAVTSLIFVGKENVIMGPPTKEAFESNLKGVIVFTPPTQEECEAIANGNILEDQMS